ncbi:UDP-glucose 4-epimerase [Nocardiopsis sp. TSRI0078]|uniref:UDP-glucose 4-epimerase GalE n=1 Tax=unclassified Nocardiopsis TaxID=2649073 RepID=UPI00093F5825|nr:UDP-glucose 4-epimerase GalE [Nocardiopsis sp. TSRI0078]OKI23301.1 UDP-glucose 4-epimerase [Nocardiopsis sp. TSRI0078]
MRILLTGGAGYIGSHTAVELVGRGHQVVVLDNLVNSSVEAVRRVEKITGARIPFVEGDCTDQHVVGRVLTEHGVDAVVHFAGLKAVGESVEQPLRYYRNNLDALLTLAEVMDEHGVRDLVFSSSATVYGDPEQVPITEGSALRVTNPYGATKLFGERILEDVAASSPDWRITVLRYFNPVGAHPSGLIGEDPNDIPNNLFPYISKVAAGRLPELTVFGDDYDTPDGTGVRDYLHVVDLARGHVAALDHLGSRKGLRAFNLGTGRGTSVLEAIRAFEQACGRSIPFRVGPRRDGDIATCFADPGQANRELGWRAEHTVAQACADAWRWQSANPDGYR